MLLCKFIEHLNKLVKIGKIHKIESRNAFIACKNSKCQIANATVFSICESCEDVTEIHDHKLSEHLRDFKDNKGMKYNKYNLEFFWSVQEMRLKNEN